MKTMTLLLASFTTFTANAASVQPLELRLGGLAYYDPNLDITWAANANINGDGTWDNQITWVAGSSIGGVSGWRLPSADVNGDGVVVDCSGGGVTGCEDNEMSYLFWEEGITFATPGPFTNVLATHYYSGTELNSSEVWGFNFNANGFLDSSGKTDLRFAWAVHDGDIGSSVVPIPATAWLLGSGLLGLIGTARKK